MKLAKAGLLLAQVLINSVRLALLAADHDEDNRAPSRGDELITDELITEEGKTRKKGQNQ